MNPTSLSFHNLEVAQEIVERVPGWSDLRHFAFFERFRFSSILMLGGYMGRDASFILARKGTEPIELVVVDKFEDKACADWPAHLRATNWQLAGFGPPPNLATCARNIAETARVLGFKVESHECGPESETITLGDRSRIHVVKARDLDFLNAPVGRFRWIYLDTSHDYETVRAQLAAVHRVATDESIICGDDYTDANGWGVKRAVSEAFVSHEVFAGWIWHAPFTALKINLPTK